MKSTRLIYEETNFPEGNRTKHSINRVNLAHNIQ